MKEHLLHPRNIENADWATLLFLLCFITIAIVKSNYGNRFSDFSNLIFSDKYNKVYKESSHLKSGFTIALFVIQIISLSFFIQLSLSVYGYCQKTDWNQYIQIANLLLFFILAKYLTEKVIATSFHIEEFVELFNLQKVTYRTYISLILLPLDIIFYYYDYFTIELSSIIAGILILINGITYLITIKNHQKIIFGKLFYFILYLCTLEIAPYYFIYFWITKGIA